MLSAVGLFIGRKSKISQEQNVIFFLYTHTKFQASKFNNIKKNRQVGRSPLSILYRLFFETQGRKHGRNLSWSWSNYLLRTVIVRVQSRLGTIVGTKLQVKLFMGTIIILSWHIRVSAQLYVTTINLGHSLLSMIMYGQNRVWSQWYLGTINCVWTQSYVSTIMYMGTNYVLA